MKIVRRLGSTPAERGCHSNATCPDIFELDDGSFAIVGRAVDQSTLDLPSDAGVAPHEAVVIIPREALLDATERAAYEAGWRTACVKMAKVVRHQRDRKIDDERARFGGVDHETFVYASGMDEGAGLALGLAHLAELAAQQRHDEDEDHTSDAATYDPEADWPDFGRPTRPR